MSATQRAEVSRSSNLPGISHWGPGARIAFRFCFLYFGLYCLLTQIFWGLLPVPGETPDPATLRPFRDVVIWTAQHVFAYKQPLIYRGSGRGDKVFDWVLVFCIFAVAVAGACVWSAFDRRRTNYETLYKWFHLFLRFAVAGQLLTYGMIKVIPLQMPFPFLRELLERFGDFSPMGVLWFSVGASPAYERFVGSAELVAGLLLIVPITTMLGALICLADMIEVFVLNMTYDVPVKQFSFHMILMALFLLLPARKRLMQFCFQECTVERPRPHQLFASAHANRISFAAQVVFGLLLVAANLYQFSGDWHRFGGGAPKSPFYGIWDVDEMRIDGVVRSPLLTDYRRWRRVIFERPGSMAFERMDDSFGTFASVFDPKRGTLALNQPDDKKWKGELRALQQGHRLFLEGKLGQHTVRIEATDMGRSRFLLVSRGFHWIQDYPFNR
jgi:hypothetical protein